jgi:hypothetical protein
MADRITDRSSPSVIPTAKVNIWPLCRPSPPIFLLLLPHPNFPLLQTTSPPKTNLPLLSTSHISLSFVVTASVFWFTEVFFLHAISVYKTIGNIFFTDSFSDRMRCYRWTLCRRKFSISDLVSKKITNELLISYRRNMFVGKTVKSVVLREFFSYLCLLMNTGIENYVGKGHCNIRTKQFWQYF